MIQWPPFASVHATGCCSRSSRHAVSEPSRVTWVKWSKATTGQRAGGASARSGADTAVPPRIEPPGAQPVPAGALGQLRDDLAVRGREVVGAAGGPYGAVHRGLDPVVVTTVHAL